MVHYVATENFQTLRNIPDNQHDMPVADWYETFCHSCKRHQWKAFELINLPHLLTHTKTEDRKQH